MTSDLLSLRDIIVSAIDSIVDVCTQSGREFPSLDDPVHPSEFTPDGIRNNPQVLRFITLAVAASTQLIATLQAPATSLTVAALMVSRLSFEPKVYSLLMLQNVVQPPCCAWRSGGMECGRDHSTCWC